MQHLELRAIANAAASWGRRLSASAPYTLSAAGAVEAVFTLLTLDRGRVPPTINYEIPDPAIPLDVVPGQARDASIRHALSNSFGFGGQDVSLVMSREPK
jgi:3-oxoacyl-[acyl-carrier-protein] synthase II